MVDVSLWKFSSGPQASWGHPFHPLSFHSSVRTSATQICAEWWLLDAERQALHMLCSELFSSFNFHIFKGSLKAISVTIVSRSSCIASPKLSVTAGLLYDRLQWARGQSFSNVKPEICSGKKPSAIQPVSLGACVAFYPIFDWSLGPMTICPLISHLFKHNHRPTKQLQLSTQCHSLAFTSWKS